MRILALLWLLSVSLLCRADTLDLTSPETEAKLRNLMIDSRRSEAQKSLGPEGINQIYQLILKLKTFALKSSGRPGGSKTSAGETIGQVILYSGFGKDASGNVYSPGVVAEFTRYLTPIMLEHEPHDETVQKVYSYMDKLNSASTGVVRTTLAEWGLRNAKNGQAFRAMWQNLLLSTNQRTPVQPGKLGEYLALGLSKHWGDVQVSPQILILDAQTAQSMPGQPWGDAIKGKTLMNTALAVATREGSSDEKLVDALLAACEETRRSDVSDSVFQGSSRYRALDPAFKLVMEHQLAAKIESTPALARSLQENRRWQNLRAAINSSTLRREEVARALGKHKENRCIGIAGVPYSHALQAVTQ